jgi:sugar/nucleoside kinase (ribokinase family)
MSPASSGSGLPGAEEGAPQFLVIGHAVQDLLPGNGTPEWRLGGAAAYASALAARLGLRTALLTSSGPQIDLAAALPGVVTTCVPSETSTQFRNVYGAGRRRQFIPRRASRITPADLPDLWRGAGIVLLGPVAGEVDEALAACFPDALIGVGAQGWLRDTAPDTSVRPLPPESWDAAAVLRSADALFLSDEDIPPEAAPAALKRWGDMVQILAFTRGYDGADVLYGGEWRHIGAFPAHAVDPTGAGDVFAAGFLVRFRETGDPWESARFAACAASFVVEGEGTSAIPGRNAIEDRLRRNPDIIAA